MSASIVPRPDEEQQDQGVENGEREGKSGILAVAPRQRREKGRDEHHAQDRQHAEEDNGEEHVVTGEVDGIPLEAAEQWPIRGGRVDPDALRE